MRTSDNLLPTPTGSDFKSRGPNSKQVGIDNFLKLLPTPTSGRPDQEMSPSQLKRNSLNLAQTMQLLPTPRAGNPGSRPNKKGGKILAEEIAMLPTPTVHGNYNRKGASKNSGNGLATVLTFSQADSRVSLFRGGKA